MNISKMKRSTQIAIMTGAGSGTVEKTVTGAAPLTLSDSVAGNILGITINGRSEVSAGSIVSVGDNGLMVTTTNSDSTETSTATITTGLPLRSVSDSIYDTLDNEKVVKKCAEVDMGTLTWEYASNRFQAQLSGSSVLSGGVDAICDNYTLYKGSLAGFSEADKSINVGNLQLTNIPYVLVRDTSYTDSTTFATAMSGVKLVYPLATPTETPLTSAEKSALASLRTYDHTTHIDATDAPTMTVKYMGKNITRTAPKKRSSRKKKA